MTALSGIETSLRRAFCSSVEVHPVPIGFAVSTGFVMPDGDLLSFYLVPTDEGKFRLEDDGNILPTAIASGFDLRSPAREGLLRGMLADEGAHYDADFAIRSEAVDEADIGKAATRFISALIRTRDLTLLSRENVAASFADDVRAAVSPRLPAWVEIDDETSKDVDADLLMRDRKTGLKVARLYAAGSDLRLMDALVEHKDRATSDSTVIAVVDRRRSRVTEKRFNMATNHGLPMAVVYEGDASWVERVLNLLPPRELATDF